MALYRGIYRIDLELRVGTSLSHTGEVEPIQSYSMALMLAHTQATDKVVEWIGSANPVDNILGVRLVTFVEFVED